jgi:hypothetical protein
MPSNTDPKYEAYPKTETQPNQLAYDPSFDQLPIMDDGTEATRHYRTLEGRFVEGSYSIPVFWLMLSYH